MLTGRLKNENSYKYKKSRRYFVCTYGIFVFLYDLVLELIAPLPGAHVNISFHTLALGIQIIFPL